MAFVLTDDGARVEVHHNTKGAINELIATAWLMKQGYDVFRNQSPRGRADLVATKWDEDGWLAIDVKSEQFDLNGFTPMNEGQREAAFTYQHSNLRYLVVRDNGNCFWYDELENDFETAQTTHWVDPKTGQRFLHPRNDMSKNEWSFFCYWMLKHHRDKIHRSAIDFLDRIARSTQGRGHSLTRKDKEWLKKIHRSVFRKITKTDPDSGKALDTNLSAANDNAGERAAA